MYLINIDVFYVVCTDLPKYCSEKYILIIITSFVYCVQSEMIIYWPTYLRRFSINSFFFEIIRETVLVYKNLYYEAINFKSSAIQNVLHEYYLNFMEMFNLSTSN